KRDMQQRLDKAHAPPGGGWRPDFRRQFRRGLQDPAPFAAGAAARRAGADLDSSRKERALLGALIERPALLHLLAEELARLPIANEELERLRSGLLDALSLVPSGVEPAAEEALADGLPLESQIIAEHLQRNG